MEGLQESMKIIAWHLKGNWMVTQLRDEEVFEMTCYLTLSQQSAVTVNPLQSTGIMDFLSS